MKLRRQNKRNGSEHAGSSPNECCFVKIANSQPDVWGFGIDTHLINLSRFCYWMRRAALKKLFMPANQQTFSVTFAERVRAHSDNPAEIVICVVFNSRVGASQFCCFQLNSNFFRLFSTQPCSRASSCSVLRGHTSSWRFQLSHCNSWARVLALQFCFASDSLS